MRRLVILLVTAAVLGSALVSPGASLARDREMHDLNKRHKTERKTLKQQERATKNVMKGHPMSAAERKRFKKNLKMQRKMLRSGQHNETKSVKESRKFQKQTQHAQAHTSS